MAGWGCYNKLDQFIMLPVLSMAMAATTFVAQNIGARQEERANDGTVSSIVLSLAITGTIAALLFIFADFSLRLFTGDEAVIRSGVDFIHVNIFFMMFNCVNQVLAGALRGRGDSMGPMVIMLLSFVLVRQIYLYIMTRYISNTPSPWASAIRWAGPPAVCWKCCISGCIGSIRRGEKFTPPVAGRDSQLATHDKKAVKKWVFHFFTAFFIPPSQSAFPPAGRCG